MNIVQLERMIAVYEAGSFRRAAQQCGMSQPALTWSIRQLEESLNARLFERGPRGIRPTALCEQLIVRARLIVSEQARLLDDVKRTRGDQSLSIGVHPALLDAEFAAAIGRFSDQRPDIPIRISEGYSASLIGRLQRGELDLAYCAVPVEVATDDLTVEELAIPPYSIVARAGHPIFDEIESGREIGVHSWVLYDTHGQTSQRAQSKETNALFGRFGWANARTGLSTGSMSLLRLMIVNAGYIGLIADDYILEDLEAGRVRRLPDATLNPPPVSFVSVAKSFETEPLRALKAILRRRYPHRDAVYRGFERG